MSTQELLAQGRLADAMGEMQAVLRDKPSDVASRASYIQALLVAGEWDKALKQLQVLGSTDPTKAVEVEIARQAIACERVRESVFADGRDPMIMGEPSQWIADLVAANKACAESRWGDAARLREKAFEGAPVSGGSIEGTRFEWIADSDERLGPVVEAYLQGSYYWIPFNRISRMDIVEPKYLQDIVWIGATITTTTGGTVAALLPVRYPGTPGPDDMHRLARTTSYETLGADDPGGGVNIGHGQRVWNTDEGEHPILESRTIEFDAPAEGE
jgi:type VI secretion system protein ImpE